MNELPPIRSMTRKQLVRAIATLAGAPKAAVDDVITALSGVMLNELCAGRPVRLPGVGRLVPKRRGERLMDIL